MKKEINAPNIFQFATKELSQDAFLCWVFSFANPEYSKGVYKELHLLALDCFKELLGYKGAITNLEIKTQIKRIDVWIEVNGDHLIIIEDKTFSTLGNDQLEKYYKIAEEYVHAKEFKTFHCVYFKSGIESENRFTDSPFSKQWTSKNLNDLMRVFKKYEAKINHPFFRDYYERANEQLRRQEYFYKYITKEKTKEVKDDTLEAFYKKLEADKVFPNWKFNDQRGTRAYYANDYKFKEIRPCVYIQLDRLELKLKIDLCQLRDEKGKKYEKFQKTLRDKGIKAIFNKVYDLFNAHPNLQGKLMKQGRIAVHNFMILAKFENASWLVFNDKDEFDYTSTSKNLQVLKEAVEQIRIELQCQIEDIANDILK